MKGQGYYHKHVDIWKTDVAAATDFGEFDPREPGASLHISFVADASVVLSVCAFRDKGEPEETAIEMTLNAGQAVIAGALWQDEVESVVLPAESYAFRVSAPCKVLKLLVTEVK